jgi:hypothetical protein
VSKKGIEEDGLEHAVNEIHARSADLATNSSRPTPASSMPSQGRGAAGDSKQAGNVNPPSSPPLARKPAPVTKQYADRREAVHGQHAVSLHFGFSGYRFFHLSSRAAILCRDSSSGGGFLSWLNQSALNALENDPNTPHIQTFRK